MVFLTHTLQTLIGFWNLNLHEDLLFTNKKLNLLAGYEVQEQSHVYLYPIINIFVAGSWEGGLQSWMVFFILQN